ncbi:hypothetical protein IM311_06900 [Enterobacter cloacae complex sp. P40RS]|uniref:Uncharacterized protein n=1 Tax=Enterobacter pasteurii TaxID=3029761 RepID=A0ABR9Q4N7_9ENTR|nr:MULTISPECIES: hypothetical protein [Enterobacter cloacae complex]MBE4853794.1 hypothetical protein [Enterobacter pasteurii]MBE4863626.1 hypothetical protein [Enterobacter cloacae complex sp. P40C2]MBE4875740.1 hypothetical protein [Enterobacter cloacae complex sp. P40C]
MRFARGEMTARKNAQPKQKRLRIQLLAGDYLNKLRNIFCRPERPESGVKNSKYAKSFMLDQGDRSVDHQELTLESDWGEQTKAAQRQHEG